MISLYAGFSVYCLLSLLLGPAGISTYRRLEARKAAMEANLAELGTIRQSLDTELESLKSDPDRIALEARSLGYLRKDETAIILGEKTEKIRPIVTGKVLLYIEPAALNDLEIKEISFGVFLAVLAILSSPRSSAVSRRRASPR
jgi:cell division protein FtsB